MKKQNNDKQRKPLVLNRESIAKLNEDVLGAIAGGCGGMPPTCRCPDVTFG